MIAHRGRPIAKDILMDLFWRDADPDAARNNLNVAIYGLRQALRATRPDFSHVLFQDDHYLLNPAMGVWVDVEEFVLRYETGQTLERKGKLAEAVQEYEAAEGLYQGDLFEEDLYQDWLIPRREGLKDTYLVILSRLSRHHLKEKRYATSIHLCRKILAEDDCREDAHRCLMRCYSGQGQRNLALRQYHLCVETLARVLDVSPTPDTVALYHQIRTAGAV
jgi:DNA-binding SARP family transcriptional activator